jgi:anti-sigma B factor antagonist
MSGELEPSPGDVLHVEGRYDDTEATIFLDGEFDMAGVARFWGYVSAVLAAHPLSIAVDVEGLTFIDSSGLAALLRARDTAAEARVPLRVIKPSRAVRLLVQYTGVQELLADE